MWQQGHTQAHESLSISQEYYSGMCLEGGNRYKGSEGEVRRVSENRDIRFNQICGDSKLQLCPSLLSVCSARSIVSLPLSIRYFLFSFLFFWDLPINQIHKVPDCGILGCDVSPYDVTSQRTII